MSWIPGEALAWARRLVPRSGADWAWRLASPLKRQLESSRRAAEALWGGPLPQEEEALAAGQRTVRIGILKDRASYYVYHLLACRELGIPFTILDLEASHWVAAARAAECDGFLVWPSLNMGVWKEIYDERLPLLAEITGKPVSPSVKEIWLLDSKRRVRDWLAANGVPHPATEIFYEEKEALVFAKHCELPVVLKTNGGSSSHGIFVLRRRGAVENAVRRAFGRGIRAKRGDPRDRACGYVILQAYVPHEHEWRIMRIGDYFLCRRKRRVGDFASGAKQVEWATPTPDLLDFAEAVTDRGGFRTIALDIFLDAAVPGPPRFLVNEMQCLVGAAPVREDPQQGRWLRHSGEWTFEAGDFYRNACANLRVDWLLERIGASDRGNGGSACEATSSSANS